MVLYGFSGEALSLRFFMSSQRFPAAVIQENTRPSADKQPARLEKTV
jgi:hypothetical protein